MPLYEYQCQDCQAAFEVRASFEEKEAGLKPECPHCQSKQTRQVLSSGPIVRVVSNHGAPGRCVCGSGDGSGCCG
jgi:putative FmdB family regulatory protein